MFNLIVREGFMKIVDGKKAFYGIVILALTLLSGSAFAQENIGDMASNITDSFKSIGMLFIAAAYIAGFALTVAAIFKFKAHKDNPTQVPLGTPIALLVIGVLLVFIPSIFGPAGSSIFSNATVGGFTGEGITATQGND